MANSYSSYEVSDPMHWSSDKVRAVLQEVQHSASAKQPGPDAASWLSPINVNEM